MDLKQTFDKLLKENQATEDLLTFVSGYVQNLKDRHEDRILDKLASVEKGYMMKLSDILTDYKKNKKLTYDQIAWLEDVKKIITRK